jgi:hypothetical protein
MAFSFVTAVQNSKYGNNMFKNYILICCINMLHISFYNFNFSSPNSEDWIRVPCRVLMNTAINLWVQ